MNRTSSNIVHRPIFQEWRSRLRKLFLCCLQLDGVQQVAVVFTQLTPHPSALTSCVFSRCFQELNGRPFNISFYTSQSDKLASPHYFQVRRAVGGEGISISSNQSAPDFSLPSQAPIYRNIFKNKYRSWPFLIFILKLLGPLENQQPLQSGEIHSAVQEGEMMIMIVMYDDDDNDGEW